MSKQSLRFEKAKTNELKDIITHANTFQCIDLKTIES